MRIGSLLGKNTRPAAVGRNRTVGFDPKRKLANAGFREAKMSCQPCGGARLRDSAAVISGCTASGNLFANFTSDAGFPWSAMNSSITAFHRSRPSKYAGDNR
jgi:hypothetical protein